MSNPEFINLIQQLKELEQLKNNIRLKKSKVQIDNENKHRNNLGKNYDAQSLKKNTFKPKKEIMVK